MIAILDYGVGNLFSLRSSLQQLGLQAVVTADADAIRAADRLILPGVGAFGDAMAKLTATGLVPVLKEQAEQKPLLGICLGMQLLFEKSYEYGEHAGLGFIKGEVCPLGPDLADKSLKVPQMGWNALHIVKDDPLFRYIREGEYVYYVHSYYGKNCAESTLAVSDYSIPVTGAVRAGRVCQGLALCCVTCGIVVGNKVAAGVIAANLVISPKAAVQLHFFGYFLQDSQTSVVCGRYVYAAGYAQSAQRSIFGR